MIWLAPASRTVVVLYRYGVLLDRFGGQPAPEFFKADLDQSS
jgi:hypothetical protein